MAKFRWPRWTSGTTFVAVLCVVAALIGAHEAQRSWRYLPAVPPNGCSLVRPEIVDIVVPGHDPSRPRVLFEVDGGRTSNYAAVSRCEVDSATTTLGITIRHAGYGPEGGPRDQAHALFARFEDSPFTIPADLGDESLVRQLNRRPDYLSLWYIGRVGAHVVLVYYGSSDPVTYEAACDAAYAVLQEVLSQL
jgi:hypothetical protein